VPIDPKIHPRNLTARQFQRTAGNPVTTLLESGVGNCFPGLEMDIRNLERRFFPFLAVDLNGNDAIIVGVDIDGAENSDSLTAQQLAVYEKLSEDTANPNKPRWLIRKIDGNFPPFGKRSLNLDTLGDPGQPADTWTAVMLIPEGDQLKLHLSHGRERKAATLTIAGRRQAYLDRTGALSSFFEPGEMTQSLCSPWTHDFRDCGCFYWASNHPDIVQLQKPAGAEPVFEADRMVPWERSVKGSFDSPPAPALADRDPDEMAYYEISKRWQELAIVLDGREQGGAYAPSEFHATPFPDMQTLVSQLHYAAGVELGVTQEYLAAAYSLRTDRNGELGKDILAANAEIMRIAIGEMRHLRAVNDVLRGLHDPQSGPFEPSLRVAAELPAAGGNFRPPLFRALTGPTLTDFIEIERPSLAIDGLYGRILATLRQLRPGPLADTVTLIMTEGNEHFETFSYIQDWLKDHDEPDYLIPAQPPPAAEPLHLALQTQYSNLLDMLFRAYHQGVPEGAALIAQARTDMLSGINGACQALAKANFLVTFDTSTDPRFVPIPRPQN
jgi:Ferritin-like